MYVPLNKQFMAFFKIASAFCLGFDRERGKNYFLFTNIFAGKIPHASYELSGLH